MRRLNCELRKLAVARREMGIAEAGPDAESNAVWLIAAQINFKALGPVQMASSTLPRAVTRR